MYNMPFARLRARASICGATQVLVLIHKHSHDAQSIILYVVSKQRTDFAYVMGIIVYRERNDELIIYMCIL